jgi:acetate kinase
MTKSNKNCVLTINGGSSSIKLSLYKIEDSLSQLWYAEMEDIGTSNIKLNFTNTITHQKNSLDVTSGARDTAVNFLIDWLEKQEGFDSIKAIGHRIVRGMTYMEPEQVTPGLLDELKKISATCEINCLTTKLMLISMVRTCRISVTGNGSWGRV